MHLNPSSLLALCVTVPAVIAGPVARSAEADGVLKRDDNADALAVALPVPAVHLQVRQEEPEVLAGRQGGNGQDPSHAQPAKGGRGGKGSGPTKGGNGGKGGESSPPKGSNGGHKGGDGGSGSVKGGNGGKGSGSTGGTAGHGGKGHGPAKGGNGGKGSGSNPREGGTGGKGGPSGNPGKGGSGTEPGKGGSGTNPGKGGKGGHGGEGNGGKGAGEGKGGHGGKGDGGPHNGNGGNEGGKPGKGGDQPKPGTNGTIPSNSTVPSGTKPPPGKASNLPGPVPATEGEFNLLAVLPDGKPYGEVEHTNVGEGLNLGGDGAVYTWNQTSSHVSLGKQVLAYLPGHAHTPARVAAVDPRTAASPLLCRFVQKGQTGLFASCGIAGDRAGRLALARVPGSDLEYLTVVSGSHVEHTVDTKVSFKAVRAGEDD